MGNFVRTALERWLTPTPADERASELERRMAAEPAQDDWVHDLELWSAPAPAAQPARKRKLTLDPTTGQIMPKVDPVAEREAARRERAAIRAASEFYD